MLLPFWLALSASMVLHIGVLLTPGWELPLDDEPETTPLEATLVLPAAVPQPKPTPSVPRPAVRKRPPAKPARPATPAIPAAVLPAEPVASASEVPEPEPELPMPPVAPVAESETPAPAAQAAPVAVLPAPTFAGRWPSAGRIVYQVSRGKDGFIIGQSEQRWEHDGRSYRLHAETETTGLAALIRPAKVVQESRGSFDAAGLRPHEFETQREGKPQDSVRFDLEQGQIVLGRGGTVPYVTAAQDMLSLFYQLTVLAFDIPSYPLTVATGRKVATYTITVGDELSLDTPRGVRQVRHLKVTGNAREDATEIWLDVESRLPLKIRHRDRKGEVFDQVATLIDVEPQQ